MNVGISGKGLDATFLAEQSRASKLILESRLLRAQQQHEAAALKSEEAAEIEERLSRICREKGLMEESRIHQFSAASCWALAGNWRYAIRLCDELSADPDAPERLRQRVRQYADTLRNRMAELNAWLEERELAHSDA